MERQPLVEVQVGREAFRIVESDKNRLPEGALMRVEGQFGFMEKENLNGRTYTKELWRKVLGNNEVQEKIKRRSMFGEADHPEGMETSLNRVSHVITGLWLDESNNLIMGSADILDTPSGRILATLFRYGAEVGVSSRGAGAIVEKDGRQIVDPDSYEYVTHDFVTEPSNPGSCPRPVLETAQDPVGVKESLQNLMEKDYHLYVAKKEEGFYRKLYESFGMDFDSVTKSTPSEQEEQAVDKEKGLNPDILLTRIDEMAKQLSDLTRLGEEHNESLLDKDTLIDALRKQNAVLKEKNESLERKYELANKRLSTIKTLRAQLEEANTIRARLERQSEVLKSRLDTARAEAATLTEEVEGLKKASGQSSLSRRKAEAAVRSLEKRLEGVQKQLEEAKRRRITESKVTSRKPLERRARPSGASAEQVRIGKPLGSAKVEATKAPVEDPTETFMSGILTKMSESGFESLPTVE